VVAAALSRDSHDAPRDSAANHGFHPGHGQATTAFTADVYVTVSEGQAEAATVIEAFVTRQNKIVPSRTGNRPADGENDQ
jgi:hypothetical protein